MLDAFLRDRIVVVAVKSALRSGRAQGLVSDYNTMATDFAARAGVHIVDAASQMST